MTTTNFTTSLGIALPTTGDLSGTWGDTVNDYISKYLDAAVAGALTVSTDVTLTKTTNSALGATSSQYAILIASGHAANITVTAPAISKVYLVINKSGSYTVKIRGAGPTTGITVTVSTAALVAWDGSDFVLIATTDINSLSGVLTAVKGGTGQSSYAVGDLLYASSSTALSKLADVATGNALISGGVGVAPSYGKIGLTTHVDGTLPVANGGTNATATPTAGAVAYGTGTAYAFNTAGTSGQPLLSGGAGAPTFGTLSAGAGGTGQTSYTDGQLLIGNTATTGLSKATLTAGSGVTITNGNGSITIAATGSGGTVTSVGATSPVASSGGTTPTISLNSGYGDTLNPYASKTANFFLAAPNGTAGVPTFRAIAAADIPTLNQNTTGTAANVSGVVAVANGGTGATSLTGVVKGNGTSAFTTSNVSLTSEVTGTLPVANGGTGATTLTGVVKGNGTAAFTTSNVSLTSEVTGTLPVANGGTGATSLTANNVILGNGTSAVQFVAPGTSGNVLTSDGTTWTSAAVASSLTGVTQSATPFETSLGHQAGNVSTGIDNTFVGYQAGLVVSTGNNNTALGHTALTACTTGIWNTAIGASAMEVGGTTTTACTAIGFNALASASGNNNTAVGSQAGSSISTGTNNTYIGSLASASSSSVDREIVIGYNLTGKGTQTAFIGGTSGAYNAKNVSTWETTSDERIKRNIVDSSKGLAEVNQLRVRNFNYKTVDQMPLDANGKPIIDNLDPDRLITGFIAQELQQVMPECVHMTASGLLAVSSDPIIYALVKAVQQLSAEVEQLKQR